MMCIERLLQKEMLKHISNWEQFCPPENILQHQETFLIVTIEEMLLASSGQKPRRLLTILLCLRQPFTMRNSWTKMSTMPKLRNPDLQYFHLSLFILGPLYYLILLLRPMITTPLFTFNKFEISVLHLPRKYAAMLYMHNISILYDSPSTMLNK